jgi:hypothetical protein
VTPTPPPWIAGLPQDDRGFFIPAEAGWDKGVPLLSSFSIDRTVVLAVNRACAVCGYAMDRGRLAYRAFAQSDAASVRLYERDHTNDNAGPLHLSCVLYSAIVCPYLREKHARLGKRSKINPGGKRGTRAAVMGFRDFALMVNIGRRTTNGYEPQALIQYLQLEDDIPYCEGTELLERFRGAVETDSDVIDATSERLFWTDNADDSTDLVKRYREVSRWVQASEPAEDLIIVDGRPFEVHPL